jgi:protein TonB
MPITANDPFSETAADLAKTESQGPQPGASGAEIPVTVHASRYSAAAKGAAKLPPIHEETSTVIIFPQGAVVRLSATVTPGELVVLTNTRTGSDVICRVTNVKTQPGIQNYVHLEFTQRALDFWQEPAATPQVTPIRKAPSSATPQLVPTTASPRTSPTTQQADPAANISATVAEMKPVPVAIPQITSLADGPASPSEIAKPHATKARISEPISSAAPVSKPAFVPSSRPQLQPFESSLPKKSSSKSVVVFAVAAVVLLTVCAVTATVLLRQDRTAGSPLTLSTSSGAAKPTPPPEAAAPATPINSSAQAKAPEPVSAPPSQERPAAIPTPQLTPVRAAEPPKTILTETLRSKVELAPHPAAQPPARPALNVGKIAAPRSKAAAQLSSAEPPPVLASEPGALPNLVSEVRATAPAPAVTAPVKGGQLQQPKLLSSVSAVYSSLARSQRLQGDVTIDALIDANGNVASMKILSGNALLQSAATDALRRWKYQPARLDGQPIPVHINVTITFRLN